MIPGLEYEQPSSYDFGSPSSSVQSVDISPQRPADYGLHRRRPHGTNGQSFNNAHDDNKYAKRPSARVIKKFDLFPKTDRDYEVRTDRGAKVTLMGYFIMMVLVLAEVWEWRELNRQSLEHIVVDTSLNKKMRVYLNITFPALHCDDLHLDVIDVAGDSQLDLSNNLFKQRLNRDGSIKQRAKIATEANIKHDEDKKRQEALAKTLPEDYCGPCYGAHEKEDDCCNTCDDVIERYKKKRWNDAAVLPLAEQCIREGRGKNEPKKMSKGEGCNLHGHFTVNRVAGNFHIAMGEGVDRDGRHIHQFLPEDRINFNASHTIHELVFSDEEYGEMTNMMADVVPGERSMNSVSKLVTEETGTTGLFQYFIKVVPTMYKGDILDYLQLPYKTKENKVLETNRFFYTERFRPLIGEVHEEAILSGDKDRGMAGAHVGGKTGGTLHEKMEHHDTANAILPGVFFVYEIYPFAVEVTKSEVPLIHLLIRIMATAGGVFTILRWIDGALYSREKRKTMGN
ncbi:hypothetical protein ACHAW6_002881 [Cyclotella cf. meneghiniana]